MTVAAADPVPDPAPDVDDHHGPDASSGECDEFRQHFPRSSQSHRQETGKWPQRSACGLLKIQEILVDSGGVNAETAGKEKRRLTRSVLAGIHEIRIVHPVTTAEYGGHISREAAT